MYQILIWMNGSRTWEPFYRTHEVLRDAIRKCKERPGAKTIVVTSGTDIVHWSSEVEYTRM